MILNIFSRVSWPSVCLFRSSSHFLIGLFGVSLILSSMSCLYNLEINHLSIASFANVFSHSEGCLFIFFMVSFAAQKLLSLISSHLFIFVFIELPYDQAIPLLGMHPEKTIIQKDTCTPVSIAALFTIARTWKQPKCLSTDE